MRNSKQIVQYLNVLRKQQDISISELARRVNMAKSGVSRYFNYTREFPINRVSDFAKALHTTSEDILGVSLKQHVKPSNVEYLYDSNAVVLRIPLLGKIAAGTPITAVENVDDYVTEIFDKDDVPSGDLFALRTNGHSMEPTIPDKSIIIFREQPSVEDGEIAAILVNHDEKATVKRVKHIDGITMLIPDNKKYDPILLTKDNPGRVIGRAIEVKEKRMNELKLTDQEAQKLIDLIKHLIKNYSNHLNTLTNEDRGTIKIKSKDNKYTFSLDYIFALNNNHLNFRDNRTNYTLVRINLDDKFHKNSDGIVKGNRIEIFSETEYIAKNDGYTHYKAYPLPFGNVKNTDDFFEALLALFEYTHVDSSNLELNRQTTLFNN